MFMAVRDLRKKTRKIHSKRWKTKRHINRSQKIASERETIVEKKDVKEEKKVKRQEARPGFIIS